jgi:threonine/homoserine/homoserine lactone efflux protein
MTPANAERQRRSYDAKRLVHCCDLALALSGISVALVEILVAVIAGNFLGIHATTDWINFLALLGSAVLTFLASAEIDPRSLKANLRASGIDRRSSLRRAARRRVAVPRSSCYFQNFVSPFP